MFFLKFLFTRNNLEKCGDAGPSEMVNRLMIHIPFCVSSAVHFQYDQANYNESKGTFLLNLIITAGFSSYV